jgi:hypothetical protein
MKLLWVLWVSFFWAQSPNSKSIPGSEPIKYTFRDTLKLGNGDFFIGKVLNNIPHGVGYYYFIDSKDGSTVLAFAKMIYSRSGSPTFSGQKTPLGNYFGKWVHSKAEGMGSIYYKDGTYYSGNFHEGLPNGFGQLTYSGGYKYEGNFENGFKTQGKLFYANGNSFTGTFINEIPFSGAYKNSRGEAFNPSFNVQGNETKNPQNKVNPNQPLNSVSERMQGTEMSGTYRPNQDDFNSDIPNSRYPMMILEYSEKIPLKLP